MNILIYLDEYLPYSQTFVSNQIEYLSEKNRIVILCHKIITTDSRHQVFLVTNSKLLYRLRLKLQRLDLYIGIALLYRNILENWVNKIKPDIILCHFGNNFLDISQTINSIPIYGFIHGYDGSKLVYLHKRYKALLTTHSNLKNRHLLFVSQYLLETCRTIAPKINGKVHHLGIPVAPKAGEMSEVTTSQITLLQVSRFVEKKGINISIEAIGYLSNKYPELMNSIQLHLVGDGPLFDQYKLLASKLGLEGYIHFDGQLSHKETLRKMETCQIYIQPSIIDSEFDSEGLSIGVAEALLANKLVITTKYSGIAELLDEDLKGTFIVNPNSIEIAELLLKILNKDIPLSNINSRNIIEKKYDIKKQTEKLESLFHAR